MLLKRVIGLQLDGRDFSPFLYRDKSFDSFREDANTPSANYLSKRIDGCTEVSLATAVNIQLLILSGIVTLLGLSKLISVSISGTVHEMLDRVLGHVI